MVYATIELYVNPQTQGRRYRSDFGDALSLNNLEIIDLRSCSLRNGSQTVEECRADKTGGQRDFLCHLALQSVMSKHDCGLDPKYKLPKLT